MSRPKAPSSDCIKSSPQFIGKGEVIDLPPAVIITEYRAWGWVSFPVMRPAYDFTVWHKLLNAPLNLEG